MQHRDMRLSISAGRLRSEAGFSLMEVLVSGMLGILVLGTVNSFSRYQLFSLRNQAVQSEVQMVARSVSHIFARDVRRSGLNPTCAGGVDAVDVAKPDELRLESDLNRDGVLDGVNEILIYRLVSATDGDRFERIANGVTDVLIDKIDLAETKFRYFDDAGAEVSNGLIGLTNADKANVRRIRLELDVNAQPVDPTRAQPIRVRLGNDINIRNRHFVNTVACP